MSFRYSNNYKPQPQPEVQPQLQAQTQEGMPRERRLIVWYLITFLVVSLIVLWAGRFPIVPSVTPLDGPNAANYQAQARALLGSYGTTAEGKVHISIDRAMELIAQRGLPVRDNPSPTP